MAARWGRGTEICLESGLGENQKLCQKPDYNAEDVVVTGNSQKTGDDGALWAEARLGILVLGGKALDGDS